MKWVNCFMIYHFMILFKILVVVAMVIILKSVTDYFNMQSQL